FRPFGAVAIAEAPNSRTAGEGWATHREGVMTAHSTPFGSVRAGSSAECKSFFCSLTPGFTPGALLISLLSGLVRRAPRLSHQLCGGFAGQRPTLPPPNK